MSSTRLLGLSTDWICRIWHVVQEPALEVAGGDPARLSLSKDAVPMPRDETVPQISQRRWHEREHGKCTERPIEYGHCSERCSGLDVESVSLDEHER